MTAKLKIQPWGLFQLQNAEGICTPKGMKECGLLALLAYSPQMHRPREWLQDKLWSDRTTGQAQTSLRRALSNLRKNLGSAEEVLCSDRNAIWLEPRLVELQKDAPATGGEFCESLVIKDPEFEEWRRDLQQQMQGQPVASLQPAPAVQAGSPRLRVHIQTLNRAESPLEAFALEHLSMLLTKRLLTLGEIEIVTSTGEDSGDGSAFSTTVELRSHSLDGWWNIHLRLLSGAHRSCFWADHLGLKLDMQELMTRRELAPFVSRAVGAIAHRLPQRQKHDLPRCLRVQRASELLFTGNRSRIDHGDLLLEKLQNEEYDGMVAAWRAFAKLTQALEFGDFTPDVTQQALSLADDSLIDTRSNSVVVALASIVNMKLGSDFDYGFYLAKEAHGYCEDDPYALNALSQAHFFRGDYAQAYQLSKTARSAAAGLPNKFYWDIQACLAALGVRQLEEARDCAWQSHLRWPTCRPPLRYLVALSLLQNDLEGAEKFAAKLRQLEPDFEYARLLDRTYPVETLRRVDMISDLSAKIEA